MNTKVSHGLNKAIINKHVKNNKITYLYVILIFTFFTHGVGNGNAANRPEITVFAIVNNGF